MKQISAFVAGLLFGLGLLIAGMADPAKVMAFLDLAGHWDPSLALVMIGAIGITLWPMRWAKQHRSESSLLGAPIQLPLRTDIDKRLVLGSLVFGMGWGLAGICPGPALALLATGNLSVWIFFIALILGMWVFQMLERRAIP